MIMSEKLRALLAGLARAMIVVMVAVFSNGIGHAQDSRQTITPPAVDKDKSEQETPSNLEETMRAKRAIKAAEKEYQENVDRARDLSELGEAVNSSYKHKTSLSKEDLRKIEKAEKLAKAIRNAAGGSEDDNQIERPPKDLADALCMLADVSASLKKNVENTPKYVVSAAVIDEANVLLELTRIIRTLIPNH
jgi:hypothetical protein